MNNLSLEQLYLKINNRIKLVSSFLEDKTYSFIIPACRLKPLSIFKRNFNYHKLKLEKIWVDEFGNHLIIKDNQAIIQIKEIKEEYISTDLYKFEKLNFIVKNSHLAYIKLTEEGRGFILSLLGNDERLRTYQYNDKYSIISPLILNLPALKEIAHNNKIKYFKQINHNEWITHLPINNILLSNIDNQELRNILK